VHDYNNAVNDVQTMLQRSLNNKSNQSQAAKTNTRTASGNKSMEESQLTSEINVLSDALTELTTPSGHKSAEESQLSNDFISLNNALKELNKIRINEVLFNYERHWYVMQAHDKQLRANAAVTPLDSNQIIKFNTDLEKMNKVWESFQSERVSLDSMANLMNNHISDARRYVPKLQDSLKAAQKLGVISNATQNLVTAQIEAGNKQTKEFQAVLKDTQQQTDTYESKAKQLLQDAEQLVSGLKPSK
jgi:chromosome segregation ATPase